MKREWSWLLWCLMLVGCGASPRVVRLETGAGAPHVFTSRPEDSRPLEVDEDEVLEAIAELGKGVRPSAQPLREARRWLGEPAHSGTLFYEVRRRKVVPLDEGSARALEQDRALVKAYRGWCERRLGPGDCLRILKDGWRLDDEGRYALAMAIAYGSVLGETKEAFGKMVDPVAVTATIVSAGTVYMLLWVLPEPVSKGIAGAMTVILAGYLGVDTVWGIIGGWKRLVDAVDGATTFEEIRAAGEAYGEVLGERAARLFIMVGTAAVGHTAAQFSSRMPQLPEFQQLALNVKGALHVRLGAVAQVRSVAVSAQGVVITLAPGAMAMAESGLGRWQQGPGGGWQPPREGPGEWVKSKEHMPVHSRDYQAEITGAPPDYAYRVKANGEEADFDDFKDGTLLEVKGKGYAKWIDDELEVPSFYTGIIKMMEQARRQLEAANGTPIRWVVAEEKLARLLRKLFTEAEFAIEVVHISSGR